MCVVFHLFFALYGFPPVFHRVVLLPDRVVPVSVIVVVLGMALPVTAKNIPTRKTIVKISTYIIIAYSSRDFLTEVFMAFPPILTGLTLFSG